MAVELMSPAPGKVLKIYVTPGDRITDDTIVAVLEAMKMEINIYPPSNGNIEEIKVREGQHVETDEILMVIGCA